jgi:hypothetical protein
MTSTPFTLYADHNDFVILCNGDPAQALRVRGLPELLHLRAKLNQFVDTQQHDGVLAAEMPDLARISTGTARKLASERGLVLSLTTLISACERGSIEGACKEGSHWTMPRWAFERWFAQWAERPKG